MNLFKQKRARLAGFTLPTVLIVVSALLILVIGLLTLIQIERKTARSFVNRQRAGLAAIAGVEEVKGLLLQNTANDHYLVIQSALQNSIVEGKPASPLLFLVNGEVLGNGIQYRYTPLCSTVSLPLNQPDLKAPVVEGLLGSESEYIEFPALPYLDRVRSSWIAIKDDQGRIVSRYAYWVEDLQSKIDAKTAGNTRDQGLHGRRDWPSPAPGLNLEPASDLEPRLNEVALHVLDHESENRPQEDLTAEVIRNRRILISPGSVLVAAGLEDEAIKRNELGKLMHPMAAAVEESACAVTHPYTEKPAIPYARGIAPGMAGRAKLNLNELLAKNRKEAVSDFSRQVEQALPGFSKERLGGFPDDYTRTLAANAFDYADSDSSATVLSGCRGVDAYPLMNEIVLHSKSYGRFKKNSRWLVRLQFDLYVELWNMTNQEISGKMRVTYENNLAPVGVGAGVSGERLDSDFYMNDEKVTGQHGLVKIGDYYWSPEVNYHLKGDQYAMKKFVSVTYDIDLAPAASAFKVPSPYKLVPDTTEDTGISQMIDSAVTGRVSKMIKSGFSATIGTESTGHTVVAARGTSGLPGHSYGPHGFFANNMGDPRAAHYLRNKELSLNDYPQNCSPGRRNVRRGSIYDKDPTLNKIVFYGRVVPSEWPDGGHDSLFGDYFPIVTDPKIDPLDPAFGTPPTQLQIDPKKAPQRISNAGRFYSATELAHIFDPMLWSTAYDSATFQWTPVTLSSSSSMDFGGGSTLRIGRPEHPRFDEPGLRAAHLLDLFHAGDSTSANLNERNGAVVHIEGNVNLNTATRDALRALAAGHLEQDPQISLYPQDRNFRPFPYLSSSVSPLNGPLNQVGAPAHILVADRVADAIMKSRPFACAADIATASEGARPVVAGETNDPKAVFGNPKMYVYGNDLQWNDAAAEEVFARVYESSTLRSRNFRVWVVAQALTPRAPGQKGKPEVLAEIRKNFTIFADPGERTAAGDVDPASYSPRITHENEF